jgi:hypothetical protein
MEGGQPRVLRCPHCGAPLEAPPFASTARCSYCGHNITLAAPSAPPPFHAPAPATQRIWPFALFLIPVAVMGIGLLATFVTLWMRSASSSRVPAVQPATRAVPALPATRATSGLREPAAQPPVAAVERRYPLRALLDIDLTVDVDASSAHLLQLFPTVTPRRHAGDLRYEVPLDHPWFGEAELAWKNERAGRLAKVALRPPKGDDKFKNQAQIAACLTVGLGSAEVRETDHLAGERSYFWGRHFPKAWADLYSGYLWLELRDPKGIAPITLPKLLRTLDACPPK